MGTRLNVVAPTRSAHATRFGVHQSPPNPPRVGGHTRLAAPLKRHRARCGTGASCVSGSARLGFRHTACANATRRIALVAEARSRNDSGKLTSRKSQPLLGSTCAKRHAVRLDWRNPTLRRRRRTWSRPARCRRGSATRSPRWSNRRIRDVPNMSSGLLPPRRRHHVDTIAQAIAAYERTLVPAWRHSIAGSTAKRARSPIRRSAASCCSTPGQPALPATPAGASPTTSFTTSAFPGTTVGAAAL